MSDVDELRLELEHLGGATLAVQKSEVLAECVALAWGQGWAWEVLCDAKQAQWIRDFLASDGSWVWGHGRQRGKSFAALALCDTLARASKKERMRYCALTQRSAVAIISSASEDLYATCPEDLRPRRDAQSQDLVWSNKSKLIVLGTDAESFRRGRGFSRIALQVLDEVGFYQELEAVERALSPSLQVPGPTGRLGRTLYCSTPPESMAHPFVELKRQHRTRGRCLVETFRDNPRVDPERVIRSEMERTGLDREALLASTAFRREFGGEDVGEEQLLALPAWPLRQEKLVRIEARPKHFDGYEALDLGFSPDPSLVLFAWYDFPRSLLYIERELETRGRTVAQLAEAWKAMTKEQWGHDGFDGTLLALADVLEELPEYLRRKLHSSAPRQPFLRVGDDDAMILAELVQTHGLAVLPTRKDEKHLAVDALNNIIVQERIAVHPRCAITIRQFGSTLWNRQRSEWQRTKLDHGEAVDAAVYMARNVRWQRDARPATNAPEQWGRKPKQSAWSAAFGGQT